MAYSCAVEHGRAEKEMTKMKGIVRREEEAKAAEAEEEDRVHEWEEGLPSLADLISLSQCLISPQLASAFSITSSPSPPRSPTDASLAASSSLHRTLHAYPDLLRSSSAPQATCHVDPHSQTHAGDRTFLGPDSFERICNGNPHTEGAGDLGVISQQRYHTDYTPSNADDKRHGGGVSVKQYHGISPQARIEQLRSSVGDARLSESNGNSAPPDVEFRSYGVGAAALVQKYHGDRKPPQAGDGDGDCDGEGEGEGEAEDKGKGDSFAHGNTCPYISDSSNVAIRADVDDEAEESESTPSLEETTVRTLKRPRLVWTPELHKRFVDAVSHLGVKTAVPKTIMQLMNVEGLTRENVASHLQKYRLYLKRVQGLSNEGPTSSDHLFASTPLPVSLPTPGRCYAGLPAHLQDIRQVPFTPSRNPAAMGRGHVAGIVSGPLPPMGPYSYNMFARPAPRRFVQGDVQDVHGFMHHHSASSQHVPR